MEIGVSKDWSEDYITQYLTDFVDGKLGVNEDELRFLRLACVMSYIRKNYPNLKVTLEDIHCKSVNLSIDYDNIQYETLRIRMTYQDYRMFFYSRTFRNTKKTFEEFMKYLEEYVERNERREYLL